MSWDAAFPVPDDIDLPPEWDHPGGHWTGSKGDVVAAPGSRPPVTTVTSTAINHDTGTAADGQLFSRAAIEVGTILRGHITGRADVLDVLAASLADHDRLELGGRSSVLGAVRLAVQPENPPAAPTGPRVVLRTLAPSFLLDDAGRPSLNLESELRRLGYQGTVEKVWSRPVTEGTGGYHAASRLPKPADVGLAAGTTAVLCPIPDDTAVLATVAGRGIGVRRPEGFGWVVFTGTPWQDPQPPSSSDGRGFSPQPGSDHAEYAELVESLRNARLDQVQRRWLGQRLGDGGGTATDVDAVLQQPGAGDLTSAQVAVVRRALTRDAEFRRRLADHLREEGHR
jgi:CRISPR-associated protein Csx10